MAEIAEMTRCLSCPMQRPQRLVIFSGAGMSAESGIPTFRGAQGLWEGHSIEEVATPQAWNDNAALVRRFYNERRRHLMRCQPNEGHHIIARWAEQFNVRIITQNVDDLHERAGSNEVLHLHGELMRSRSLGPSGEVMEMVDWEMKSSDRCPNGHHVRPHIVWFGEDVPNMDAAVSIVQQADCLLVVGTSLQVYPAAQLAYIAAPGVPVHVIDPSASALSIDSAHPWPVGASEGLRMLDAQWFT
ncbi:MAG: NAD-dependent protein deacylase [Crocinitomicaceae bacterium]|nr:NAD-dependent protein deacylase [Crocinitomicaceae bacterium]